MEGSKNAFGIYPEKNLFDNTHFNTYGAYLIAKLMVQQLKDQQNALAKYLVDMPTFDPKKPDPFEQFFWPASPAFSVVKPDGN